MSVLGLCSYGIFGVSWACSNVTLAGEDINPILANDTNRVILGKVTIRVRNLRRKKEKFEKKKLRNLRKRTEKLKKKTEKVEEKTDKEGKNEKVEDKNMKV